MKTEIKILKLLINEKGPKTIREISKGIKSDYRIAHVAVQRLLHKRVLLTKKVGNSNLCELNNDYFGIEIYEAENERRETLLENHNVRQLYKEVMGKIKIGFFVFLVFGSYAKNTAGKHSDLDMMFISDNKDFEERIVNIFSIMPIKTHVLVFTENEFMRMKDSKKSNVVKEAMEHNIILYGIETFYKMKNA